MKPDDVALAWRAVASAGWKWSPGMLTDTGIRVVMVGSDFAGEFVAGWALGNPRIIRYYTDPPLFVPDFTDAATVGAVVGLVRERFGGLVVVNQGSGWHSVHTNSRTWDNDNTPSFAAALVAALEVPRG